MLVLCVACVRSFSILRLIFCEHSHSRHLRYRATSLYFFFRIILWYFILLCFLVRCRYSPAHISHSLPHNSFMALVCAIGCCCWAAKGTVHYVNISCDFRSMPCVSMCLLRVSIHCIHLSIEFVYNVIVMRSQWKWRREKKTPQNNINRINRKTSYSQCLSYNKNNKNDRAGEIYGLGSHINFIFPHLHVD